MHELSIAMNILELATQEALRRESRVLAVHVRIGLFSGVVPEALVTAFEIACECEGLIDCRLVVEEVAVTIYCPTCAADRQPESLQSLVCPVCQSPAAHVVAGQELEVTALEIEDVPCNTAS